MANMDVCRELTEAIGAGQSPLMPRIFEALVNDDEAKVLLAAAPSATVDELAGKTGFPLDTIQEMMDSLFHRGLIFKSRKGETLKYYRVKNVPQMHDSTVLTPDVSQDVLDLWKAYMKEEWPVYGKQIMEFLPGSIMRVIPVNESIESGSRILAYDDVVKIIEGAKTLTVTKCTCRIIDGACGLPLEVCMQVDRAAEYNLERGTGRKLTRDEALDILKLSAEAGLVHVADNQRVVGHVICNCCRDCCLNWDVMEGTKKWVAPSRFEAFVDEDACTGCETCIDRCFFDALSMDDEVAVVDSEKCLGCGVCTIPCPTSAIELKEVRPEEFVPG